MEYNTTIFCVLQSGVALFPVIDSDDVTITKLVVSRLSAVSHFGAGQTHIWFGNAEAEFIINTAHLGWKLEFNGTWNCGHGNVPGNNSFSQPEANEARWYQYAQVGTQMILDLRRRRLTATSDVKLGHVLNTPLPLHTFTPWHTFVDSNHMFYVNRGNLRWGNTFWVELPECPSFNKPARWNDRAYGPYIAYAGSQSWLEDVHAYSNTTSSLRVVAGPFMWHRKVPRVSYTFWLPPLPTHSLSPTMTPTMAPGLPSVAPTLAPTTTPCPSPVTPSTVSEATHRVWVNVVAFLAGVMITVVLMCTYQYRRRGRHGTTSSADSNPTYVPMGDV